MKSSLFLILVVATQITQSTLPWISLKHEDVETKQIKSWIISSGVPEFSEFIPDCLIPLKAYNLLPDNKNSRLVLCGYNNGTSVRIFFVVIIHKKVVEIGNIRNAIPTPPPKKGDKIPDPPELKLAEDEAEKFQANKILPKQTWKNKSEVPELNHFEAFYCQFDLEFYYVGENRKILGIFSVLNTVDQNQYFCFGELESSKPIFEYRFSGMGIHYKTRIKAFHDLEEYTNKRRDILIDTWLKVNSSTVKQTDGINGGILQLKLKALDKLKWPGTEKLKIRDVKFVFNDQKKLVVIFKRAKDCYVTLAGMPVSANSSDLTLTFLDARAKTIEAARNSMENYFNLAFSDKFKRDPWVWGWEINNNISNESFPIKLISMNLHVIEEDIKKSASFEIPKGGSVYLQKIRKRTSVEGQFIAIYEFMQKIFVVIFIIYDANFSLNYIGALGTDEEVEAAYEYFCAHGNDPEKFPFSKNSLFLNGMGSAIRLPQKLCDTFKGLFDSIKASAFDKGIKPEKGDVFIKESFTTVVPAPFNLHIIQGPFWYCVPFEFRKNKTEKEGLIFFVIVKLYSDGSYSTKLVEPYRPTDIETAYNSLKYRIYFDQFVAD